MSKSCQETLLALGYSFTFGSLPQSWEQEQETQRALNWAWEFIRQQLFLLACGDLVFKWSVRVHSFRLD